MNLGTYLAYQAYAEDGGDKEYIYSFDEQT
jgi:hypothetical protein